MLFYTSINNLSFLVLFYVGIISGVLYEISVFVCKITKNSIILRNLLDVFVVFCSGIMFIFGINIVALGNFRVYLALAFALGVVIERTSIGFLVAKVCNFVYNKSIKFHSFIRRKYFDTRKTKNNS